MTETQPANWLEFLKLIERTEAPLQVSAIKTMVEFVQGMRQRLDLPSVGFDDQSVAHLTWMTDTQCILGEVDTDGKGDLYVSCKVTNRCELLEVCEEESSRQEALRD